MLDENMFRDGNREHSRSLVCTLHHLEVDHDVVSTQRNPTFQFEGNGLFEMVGASKGQGEEPIRYTVARQTREHGINMPGERRTKLSHLLSQRTLWIAPLVHQIQYPTASERAFNHGCLQRMRSQIKGKDAPCHLLITSHSVISQGYRDSWLPK